MVHVVHLNNTIGVTRMYRAIIILPTQFVPISQCHAARKRASELEAPNYTFSRRKFLSSTRGHWVSLVTVQPKNPLTSTLAGQNRWGNLDDILTTLKRSGASLSLAKCHFAYSSLITLGHRVSRLGLATHEEKKWSRN